MQYSFQHPTGMLLALIPALFNILILAYGVFYLPRNKVTRLFLFLVLCMTCWQCNDALMRMSADESTARFWDKFFSLGVFALAPLCLHFAAQYSSNRFLLSTAGLLIIYLPFIAFNVVYLALPEPTLFFHDPFWGYINMPRSNSLETAQLIAIPLVIVVAVLVLLRYSYRVWLNKEIKWQSLIISVGILIPTLQGLVTQVIFSLYYNGRQIPLASTTLTVFSLAVVVALSKYRLFKLSDYLGLDLIMRSISDIVIILEKNKQTSYINPQSLDVLRLGEDYRNKWELRKLFADDDKFKEFDKKVLDACLKGISVRNFETEFTLGANRDMEVIVNAEPIFDENIPRGVLLIARDITERKKMLLRLRTENTVFDLLSRGFTEHEVLNQYFEEARRENHGNGIVVLYNTDDQTGGLSPMLAPYVEKKYPELLPILGSDVIVSLVKMVLKSGTILEFTQKEISLFDQNFQQFLRNEKIGYVSVSLVNSPSGENLGLLAIFFKKGTGLVNDIEAVRRMQHITGLILARSKAQDNVEVQRKVYTDLVNTIDGIVYEYDLLNKKYEFVSNRAPELLGYPVENWYNEIDFQMNHAHPDDRAMLEDRPNKFFPEQSMVFEFRMISNEGETIWCKDYIRVEYRDKVPVKLKGIIVDITQAKNTELEKERTAADLIRRNRDLEQFTYIVSHNLRAPLANILGCTNAIELVQDEEDRRELLQGIAQSAQSLDSVVVDLNSILSVQKVAGEKVEHIAIQELITEVVEALRPNWKGEFDIITEIEQTPYIVSVKPYLYSIVHNLISNAYKYRHPMRKPELIIKSVAANRMVEISFKDNGQGIDMEANRQSIFGMYKRFHTDVEGKGLGLFMVKSQVEALQGNIEVFSELNNGAEFKIFLPQ